MTRGAGSNASGVAYFYSVVSRDTLDAECAATGSVSSPNRATDT